MNSYFSLIYSNEMLKSTLRDYRFVKALTHQKNILEIFFERNGKPCKMIVSVHPLLSLFFTDNRVSEKSHNVASFFEILTGQLFKTSQVSDGDRLVTLFFEDDYKLILQLFGSRPNVFLIKNDRILEAFKSPDDWEGKPQPQPRKPETIPYVETKGAIKQRIFKSHPYIQRAFVPDLIFYGNLNEKTDTEVSEYLADVHKSLASEPEFRKMSDGRFCLIPSKFIPDNDAETFANINDAIRVIFFSERSGHNFVSLRDIVLKRLQKERSRSENLIRASEESLKSLERAATYSKFGDILMANAHQKRTDRRDSGTFEDIYESGTYVEINLKPDASYAENAAYYYEKKRKSERSFEVLHEQAERATIKLKEIQKLESKLSELRSFHSLKEFLKQEKENELLQDATQPLEMQSRPYLIAQTGKFEIWIGKNAKGNDELLRDAHKEDIWMHARGVSGSHVIIRMQKKMYDPDISILELAASWAAWKSKARGAALVPVIWTRRKFVRKPKGASLGTVIVQQEKVLLVQPTDIKSEYFRN